MITSGTPRNDKKNMLNPYLPKIAIIKNIKSQTSEVKLFTLGFKNKKDQLEGVHPYPIAPLQDYRSRAGSLGCNFIPGQFVEVGLPGFGEAPFVLCSKQIVRRSEFQICVRKAGQLTSRLHNLKPGDIVFLRGPYGNGWPEEVKSQKSKVKSNLLLIAGGLGIIPFRSLILSTTNYNKLQQVTTSYNISLLYGAKTYDDLLFKNEYKTWQKNIDLHIILEKPDSPLTKGVRGLSSRWKGHVGLITDLFDKVESLQMSNVKCQMSNVFLCGPPVMYKFVIPKLKALKIPDENIYLSLERRMHCGIGTCQHCAIGSKYVCKHGPVFNWAEIKAAAGAI